MINKGLRNVAKRMFFTSNKQKMQQLQEQAAKQQPLRKYIQAVHQENRTKQRLLPPSEDPTKLTVVMELDEILAYTFTPDNEGYMTSPIRSYDWHGWFEEEQVLLSIYKRKNLQNFLNYLCEECEPVIFSAGKRHYTMHVLSIIDPLKKIKHIFTQEHCNRVRIDSAQIDEFLKDVSLLGRDMRRVLYIDTQPLSCWLQPNNTFITDQFRADHTMRNEDLDHLILQIQDLRKEQDVRVKLKEMFDLETQLKNLDFI